MGSPARSKAGQAERANLSPGWEISESRIAGQDNQEVTGKKEKGMMTEPWEVSAEVGEKHRIHLHWLSNAVSQMKKQ